jgi:Putative peptidoglycan binding domain/LysM domain
MRSGLGSQMIVGDADPSRPWKAMAQIYTVRQGDYLSKISSENGFFDHTIIWNHPNNAELKNKRVNPSVLYPGDQLYIPDKNERVCECPADKTHSFVVEREKLKLRLVLEDQYEKAVSGAQCKVIIGAQDTELTTDDKGKIELQIPLEAQTGALLIKSEDTPYDGELFSLHIGELDPVDTFTGQQARLNNLGYFPGSSADTNDPQFLSAVEEFQCDHGLTVDGKSGPNTQAKLKQEHGC